MKDLEHLPTGVGVKHVMPPRLLSHVGSVARGITEDDGREWSAHVDPMLGLVNKACEVMRIRDLRAIAWTTAGAVALVASTAHAQAPRLVDIAGNWVPSTGVGLPDDVQNLAPDIDPKVQVSALSASVNIPIRLSDDALLMPGVGYSNSERSANRKAS